MFSFRVASRTRTVKAENDASQLTIATFFQQKLELVTLAGSFMAGIVPGQSDPVVLTRPAMPEQVHATYPEPGMPVFTVDPNQPGTGTTGSSSSSSSNGEDDGTGSSSAGSGGSDNGGKALNTMLAKSWGFAAQQIAQTLGINPSALAATCVMEGCTANAVNGNAVGAFQMMPGTYSADIKAAANSGLFSDYNIDTSLNGRTNASNEAIAASWELKSAVTQLQNAGIANPTVLDTRAIYQFGGSVGDEVARASDSQNLNSIIHLSATNLAKNGLTTSTTVGEWRATVTKRLGTSTASQIVMSSN